MKVEIVEHLKRLQREICKNCSETDIEKCKGKQCIVYVAPNKVLHEL
jgi:hypothetical protein